MIPQPQLIGEILQAIDRLGVKTVNTRQMNAVIAGANAMLAELNAGHRTAVAGSGLAAWLRSDETGQSSIYMASHLAPRIGLMVYSREYAVPHDPEDFERCVKLLDAAPELRPHLNEMARAVHGKIWNRLAAEWDELERLYREERPTGRAPKLFARIQAIHDAARKPA